MTPPPAGQDPDDEALLEVLDPEQLVAATATGLPPRPLSVTARAGLWALRIGVILLTLMVIYTFVQESL